MLEICPSIADGPICIKCQPLSMGDREDPARLVFTSKEGSGIATSLIDLGNRFRLIINDVDCKKTEKPMPKLPVATELLDTAAGSLHRCGGMDFGRRRTPHRILPTTSPQSRWATGQMRMGIEAVYIDKDTKIREFKKDLMLGNLFYR